MNNLTIIILCGGNSSEREVSLSTGKAIYECLKNSLNVEIANDNAPGQVVISGIMDDLKKSEEILIKNGAKKIVYLNVLIVLLYTLKR